MKNELKKRFKEQFPEYRLLAIHLDGFSHSAIVDRGNKNDKVERLEYSAYVFSGAKISKVFEGFSHYTYQNNAVEYLYVRPEAR